MDARESWSFHYVTEFGISAYASPRPGGAMALADARRAVQGPEVSSAPYGAGFGPKNRASQRFGQVRAAQQLGAGACQKHDGRQVSGGLLDERRHQGAGPFF